MKLTDQEHDRFITELRNHVAKSCGFNKAKLPYVQHDHIPARHALDCPTCTENDRRIIDTIDKEAPSIMCWSDEQQAAWYREIDRDKAKPTAAWIETPTACHLVGEVKPYALQVCNAGAMPDHLPTSFSEWVESNNDSIDIGGNEIPDRIKANHDQYDNTKHPFE